MAERERDRWADREKTHTFKHRDRQKPTARENNDNREFFLILGVANDRRGGVQARDCLRISSTGWQSDDVHETLQKGPL